MNEQCPGACERAYWKNSSDEQRESSRRVGAAVGMELNRLTQEVAVLGGDKRALQRRLDEEQTATERLKKAARMLALETTDERIEMIASTDCVTNASVVRHWRDEVFVALASPTDEGDYGVAGV